MRLSQGPTKQFHIPKKSHSNWNSSFNIIFTLRSSCTFHSSFNKPRTFLSSTVPPSHLIESKTLTVIFQMPTMHLHHSKTAPCSLGVDDSLSFPNSMTSSYVPLTLHQTPHQHKPTKVKASNPKAKTGTIGALIMNIALPTDSRNEGKKKQTNTIEALMSDIKAYDETVARSKVDTKRKRMLEEMMTERLGGLKKMGIFDLFSPDDWIKGPSAGRKFIGELAKKEAYSNL